MLKAFTPTVTLIMLWATGIEVPSRPVLMAVFGICGGTAMASLGEGSFHVLGLSLCASAPSVPHACAGAALLTLLLLLLLWQHAPRGGGGGDAPRPYAAPLAESQIRGALSYAAHTATPHRTHMHAA